MSRSPSGGSSVARRGISVVLGVSLLGPQVGFAASDEPVVVLSVLRDGRPDTVLWQRLTDHLARNGERVVQTPRLSQAEQQCTSQECLDRVAQRSTAKYVLSVTAQRSGPENLYLTGLLYDSVRHWPRQATLDCVGCKGDVLTSRVTDLADKLFLEIRTPELTVASSPNAAPPPLVWGKAPSYSVLSQPGESSSYLDKLSLRRKVSSGVLGALSLAVFATAGAFQGLDGRATDFSCGSSGSPQSCVWSTKWLYGTGYGLGSALLIGAALTLFWPTETAAPASAERR